MNELLVWNSSMGLVCGVLGRRGPDQSTIKSHHSFKNPYPKEMRDDRAQVMDPQQRMVCCVKWGIKSTGKV